MSPALDCDVPVRDLTTKFMRCATCFDDPAVRELSPWWPPRGWAGPERIRPPVLMVVSLNPGHPLSLPAHYGTGWDELSLLTRHGLAAAVTKEAQNVVARRRLVVTREAATAVAALCWRSYTSPTRSRDHLFHRRSVAYAKACLWLMGADPDEWQEHCWFTDVVKCSTTAESNAGVPSRAVAACRRHLVEEILTVRPEVAAVLGGAVLSPVKAALAEAKSSARVISLLHPARWRKLTSDRQRRSFRQFSPPAPGRLADSEAFSGVLATLQSELT